MSFPSKESQSLYPFDLVHSDVWGPCHYSTRLGYRDFITFVDDLSIMTWIYLLKDRSSVLDVFQTFHSEIKTQFSSNIHVLRSDNALEYMKSDFSNFCSSNEIIHQTSCAYTPQQNGVTEHKNRHLLEVARTIML